MSDELVLVDRPAERVARVLLNRPERRNALTGPLAERLGDVIEDLNGDETVSVLAIGGVGGAFCSGLDLTEFNLEPRPDWVPHFATLWRRVHANLFDSGKIVVGALERAAVNGGAALALACDFLVAGDGAFLQVGEIQQGMAAPMNTAWLRLRHSEALSARVALLGDRIHGPDLVALGLAHRSVPDDDVWQATLELTDRLAAHDPSGARRIKTALRRTGIDDDAEAWFQRPLDADPLALGASRPVAARDA